MHYFFYHNNSFTGTHSPSMADTSHHSMPCCVLFLIYYILYQTTVMPVILVVSLDQVLQVNIYLIYISRGLLLFL